MDDTVTTQYKISVSVLCSAYCPLATLLLSSLYLQRFSILCCVLSRVVCVARVLSICMCFLRLQCRWALSATVSNRTYLQQFSWQHIWFVYATISPRASWSMIHIFMMTFSLGLVKIIIWFKCKKKKDRNIFICHNLSLHTDTVYCSGTDTVSRVIIGPSNLKTFLWPMCSLRSHNPVASILLIYFPNYVCWIVLRGLVFWSEWSATFTVSAAPEFQGGGWSRWWAYKACLWLGLGIGTLIKARESLVIAWGRKWRHIVHLYYVNGSKVLAVFLNEIQLMAFAAKGLFSFSSTQLQTFS